jgi:hypothetical protein
MAQTVDISTLGAGESRVEIDGIEEQTDSIAIQVTSTGMDSSINLSLVQGNDDDLANWHDLPEVAIPNENHSSLLQTISFKSNRLAVKIDKLSATVGTLTIINPDNA